MTKEFIDFALCKLMLTLGGSALSIDTRGTSRGVVIPGLFKCKNSRSNVQLVGTKLVVLYTGPFDLSHIDILLTCSAVSSDVPVHGRLAVA